jgi:hypothetical protein
MTEMSKEQQVQRKIDELNRMITPTRVPNGDDRDAMQRLLFELGDLVRGE